MTAHRLGAPRPIMGIVIEILLAGIVVRAE